MYNFANESKHSILIPRLRYHITMNGLQEYSEQLSRTCLPDKTVPLWRKIAKAAGDLLIGRRIEQPCLLRAEILYGLLRLIDRYGDYRINMVVTFYCTGDKGHAWLTRDGKFLFKADKDVSVDDFTFMGEAGRYRYYIKESNLHRWYDVDLPRCHAAIKQNLK